MPLVSDHNRDAVRLQPLPVTEDAWTTELVPRLPATRDLFARQLGALQRQRGLTTASDLLRGLLAYVLCVPSFRLLGAWAVVLGLTDLSEAAWRKRLRTANPWLLWLLTELCAAPPARLPSPPARRVLLVDATVLGVPGGCGADWRIHTAYDFTRGQLSHVVVSDRHTGEHLQHYQLQAGDIVVADGGYGYRRSVATARRAQADVVLRIHPQTFPVETADGQPIDVGAWLPTSGTEHELVCYCRYQRQRLAVRLLAVRVAPAVAQRAQAHVRQRAKKDRRTVTAQHLALTSWVLLVTTLAAEHWPLRAVTRLYRARWQIELVFKQMKSLLHLNVIRVRGRVAVEAVIRLKLIGWLLHAEVAAEVRACLGEVHAQLALSGGKRSMSSWRVTTLGVLTVAQQVLGQWTLTRLHGCLDRLDRFLSDPVRTRPHQETLIRRWLAGERA